MTDIQNIKFALPTDENGVDFAVMLPLEDYEPDSATITMIRPNRLVRAIALYLDDDEEVYFNSEAGGSLLIHSLPDNQGEPLTLEQQREKLQTAAVERAITISQAPRSEIDAAWTKFKTKLKKYLSSIRDNPQEANFDDGKKNKLPAFPRLGLTVFTIFVKELCERAVNDPKKGRQQVLRELSDYIVYDPNIGDKFKAKVNDITSSPVPENDKARIYQMLYGNSAFPADVHQNEDTTPSITTDADLDNQQTPQF